MLSQLFGSVKRQIFARAGFLVTLEPQEYDRPVKRLAVRCRKKNGQ
jgi:hypothetical protein